MKLPDVNVLVGVFRDDGPHHEQAVAWLARTLGEGRNVRLTPAVVAGFLRVASNPRIFRQPMPVDDASRKIDTLLESPLVSWAMPGPQHWRLFTDLCRETGARGNVVSDAAIAAVAIEHGATVVTFDRDFRRFPGLRCEFPDASPHVGGPT